MGARKLEALMAGLPHDSALARDVNEATAHGWSQDTELLASIAELLDVSNRYYLSAHGVSQGQLGRPLYIPRPFRRAVKRAATRDELAQMFKTITPRRRRRKPKEE